MTLTAISPRLAIRTFENMRRVTLSAAGVGGAEAEREPGDDGQRLVVQLAPGDAGDPDAGRPQDCVLAVIALDATGGAVKGEAIDLDRHALSRPQEVDLEAVAAHIGQGLGKARVSDEAKEQLLRLGARERGSG